jgi:putative toxin-antitoxin system antitoxin component (TIGR02293 family)
MGASIGDISSDRKDVSLVPTLIARIGDAVEQTDLDYADLARALDTSPRTISRWLADQTSPRGATRERLLEVLAVLEALSGVLRPEAAHDWLYAPNPSLGHEKPIDLLRAGNFRVVLGAIDAMADGVFA